MDEPVDCLVTGHRARGEDGEDDEVARVALGPIGAHQEGRAQRDRGGGVAEVVDQVGEEGDAAGAEKDRHLRQGGEAENAEGEENGADARPGAFDRGIDEAVGVSVLAVMAMPGSVGVGTAVTVGVDQPVPVAMSLATEVFVGQLLGHPVKATGAPDAPRAR